MIIAEVSSHTFSSFALSNTEPVFENFLCPFTSIPEWHKKFTEIGSVFVICFFVPLKFKIKVTKEETK